MAPPEQLHEIATGLRVLFERMLAASDIPGTAGACMYAALLVHESVQRFTPFAVRIRGGDGIGDGGYVDAKGASHGHYWVEVADESERWIVDITGDQFGGPPVLVMDKALARRTYRVGTQAVIDEHVRDALEEVQDQARRATTEALLKGQS